MKKLNCVNTSLLYDKICALLLKERRRDTVDNPDELDPQLHVTSSEELERYFPNK
jgi:hypothetical protein